MIARGSEPGGVTWYALSTPLANFLVQVFPLIQVNIPICMYPTLEEGTWIRYTVKTHKLSILFLNSLIVTLDTSKDTCMFK